MLQWSTLLWAAAGAGAFFVLFVWFCYRRFHGSRPQGVTDPAPRVLDPRLFMSAKQLSLALARGEYTSAEVVDVFIAHIESINPHLNATVFTRFDEARREAKRADKILAAARKSDNWRDVGWLTGVPISVKECIAVRGCPNTSGLRSRMGRPADEDAPQVELLRGAGAIILGVTNTSELCMWMESSNCVYGTTCNPYDVNCIVGGSSGGEGCAVAALFAPVGLGSDIGGSIRMPAYFNGVFGHKPSTRLVPNRGQHPGCMPGGRGHFLLATGPLATHAEDLYPMLRTLTMRGFLEDPEKLPPCPPLRDPALVDMRKLRVYCVEDFGQRLVRVCKPQRRAARAAAASLEARYGCQVTYVDFDRPNTIPKGWHHFRQAVSIWTTLMTSSGERTFTDFMSEGYPNSKMPLLKEWRNIARGNCQHTLPALALCLVERTDRLQPQWMLDGHKRCCEELRVALERELGDDGVLIVPTYPLEVPTHQTPILHPFHWIYTAIFNALQTPATAVPIWLDEQQRLPLGVQCVARWSRDDISLATAMGLEETLGGYRPPRWALRSEPLE
jgi:fatty acid amide hydrolase 2